MRNRRKNNIIIGTLCCVLVLMGVGYAILSTTLNIGATAKITGDFDIHFTNIQRSSSTISDSTILSTIDAGTGITANTNSQAGTFTAVLQKPTDYVIYTVSVANTGSIDGYLTFSFNDTNSNFNYYKDYYSVEFIRDDVNPAISTDILQPNASFSDPQVLVNTSGTRTYKIKVTFKESATSFPDPTHEINNQAVGNFECELSLTYSQQAPSNNSQQQNSLTWYTNDANNPIYILSLDENKTIHDMIINGTPQINDDSLSFVPYTSPNDYNDVSVNVSPQAGDYILVATGTLNAILRDSILYIIDDGHYTSGLSTVTLYEDSNYDGNPSSVWYTDNSSLPTRAIRINQYNQLVELRRNGATSVIFEAPVPYSSLSNVDNELSITPQESDYIYVDGGQIMGILRNNTFYLWDPNETEYVLTVDNNFPQPDVLTWYYGENGGMTAAIAINQYKVGKHLIVNGTEMINQMPFGFTVYTSNIQISENIINVQPQEGDYVVMDDNALVLLLRGNTMYGCLHEGTPIITATLDTNGSLEKYSN